MAKAWPHALALALLAASAAAAQPSSVPDVLSIPFLVQTHLQKAGLVPATSSGAQLATAVQTFTSILQQRVGQASQAVGSALAGLSGTDAAALAASLDQAFCSAAGVTCGSAPQQAGGRKMLLSSNVTAPSLSPLTKAYAELTAYAAAALMLGDQETAAQVIKYTGVDPGWALCVLEHTSSEIVSRPAPNVVTSYVYPLVSASGSSDVIKIAIMGDWGTGMPQAVNMLQQMVAGFSPDIVMHLGDTYYAGSLDEQNANQYAPVRQFLPSGTQYYTIPGNHDYYSTLGGQGFFNTVDQLRAEGVTQQQGSFWALEGANWVFIGLDTGATDTNPLAVNTDMPYLDANQLEWALDKVTRAKAAGKRIIMASHHQFFTAAETVGDINGTSPAVNVKLRAQLQHVLASVDVWFWGHEHTFEAFQPYAGLQRGRMLGNSAVPMLQAEQPYAFNTELSLPPGVNGLPQPVAGSPQSAMASFGYYLQHAFAIVTLQGSAASISYYQLDWNCWLTRGCQWYAPTLMWTESL